MPNKETKRQRKEQAKAQRLALQRKMARRRAMRKFYYAGIAIVVVGAIVLLVVLSGNKHASDVKKLNADVTAAATALGCGTDPFGVVKEFPSEGQKHVQTTVKYQTDPPTSGDHWGADHNPAGPGVTGVLPSQPPDEMYVHNLEHSHMAIWYDATKIPAGVKKALEDFTNKNKTYVFMAPRSAMNAVLSVVTWGHWIKCGPTMKDDPADATKLVEAYRKVHDADGPEGRIAGTPIRS